MQGSSMESTLGGTNYIFNDNFGQRAWLPVVAHLYYFISIYQGGFLPDLNIGGDVVLIVFHF